MNVEPTSIQGLFVLTHDKASDFRGSFERIFCSKEFSGLGFVDSFVQTSTSLNTERYTLRGLHYQIKPHQETKIVTCISGEVYDVSVDIRPNSPSYLHWHAEILSSTNLKSIYVPEGCANGFLTLHKNSKILYQISNIYISESAKGVHWNDPKISIKWPHKPQVISERDNNFVFLRDLNSPLI